MHARLGYPRTLRSRLALTIEHDPRSRTARVTLRDAETDELLFDHQGAATAALPPGRYLAGAFTCPRRVPEWLGRNFPPEAWVTVESIAVDQVAAPLAGGHEPADASLLPREVAGATALQLEQGAATLADVVAAFGEALARVPAERASTLLLQRADVRARHADVPGAREDLAQALRDSFGLLRAVEDDGRCLAPATAALLREALRDELDALDARLARDPRSVEALEARAVVHRLRGDRALALEDLRQADAITDTGGSEVRAWVRAGLVPTSEHTAALGAWPMRDASPEVDEFMPALWLPRDTSADASAAAAAELARLLRGPSTLFDDVDRWTRRAIGLAPDDLAPRRERAWLLYNAINSQPALDYWTWDLKEQLRVVVERDPGDGKSLTLLGAYEVASLDFVRGGEHLRAARGGGAEIAPLLDMLERSGLRDDPDWAAFRAAVAGDAAAWGAFLAR